MNTLKELLKLQVTNSNLSEAKISVKNQNEIKMAAQEGDLEKFIELYSEFYQSAVEIWGNEQLHKKLMREFKNGKQFSSFTFDSTSKTLAASIASYIKKGWTVFAEEDNFDQGEIIFIK